MEKEWNLTINENEYKVKVEVEKNFIGLINKMKIFINEQEIKTKAKHALALVQPISIEKEDKVIYIFIDSKSIDLGIDGCFIESKKNYNFDKKNMEIEQTFYVIISWLIWMFASINTKNFILELFIIISNIIYMSNMNSKIYLNLKEKLIRYTIFFLIEAIIIALIIFIFFRS